MTFDDVYRMLEPQYQQLMTQLMTSTMMMMMMMMMIKDALYRKADSARRFRSTERLS